MNKQITILGKTHLTDMIMGKINEKKVLKWCNNNNYKNNKLSFFMDRFSVVDMVSADGKDIVELKARNIRHNQYYDLIIGKNKIEEAEDNYKQADYYFYFLCKDGLYGYKYNIKNNIIF